MDRRTFMIASFGTAAIGCALPGLDCHGIVSDSSMALLILVDSALPGSRALAALAGAAPVQRIEVGPDVGALWHNRLRDWRGPMRGVLRPSDCFVLRNFSMADRRIFRSSPIGAGQIAFEIAAPIVCSARDQSRSSLS